MVEKVAHVILTDEPPHDDLSVLLADGFDDAFVGLGMRFGWIEPVAVYDYEKCLRILESRDGMDREGAEEFFQFNVLGAWVGDQTPIFVSGISLEDLHACASEE